MITYLIARVAHYTGFRYEDPDAQSVSAAPAQVVRRPAPVRVVPPRLRVDLGDKKPSEEDHVSPWQAAWDRLTPEERA